MSAQPSLFVTKIALVVFLCGISVLHFLSIWLLWYTHIWWIDIVLHVLGGAWITLVFFYMKNLYAPSLGEGVPLLFYLIIAVGVAMLVGVAWEWFEYAFDFLFFYTQRFAFRAQLGLTDTMGDLLSDFVGGVMAASYIIMYERRKQFHD